MSIVKRLAQLPVKIETLAEYIIVGQQVLKAQKAKLAAINAVEKGVAARQAALYDTQDLAEILLYAEARLGEVLEKIEPKRDKQSASRSTSLPSLPAGIDKRHSHEAQQLAKHQETIAKVVAEARETGEIPVRKHVLAAIAGPHVLQNTGQSEWFTPPEYIEAARRVMGRIDTDPATTEQANDVIKAKCYFTAETNGLDKKWPGNVWMNPPYSQPLVKQFCEAFAAKYEKGEIKQGFILINNTTETDFSQKLLQICLAVCFPRGRVKFLDETGNPGAPLQGQMILYFGTEGRKFSKEFDVFGVCLRK